MESELATAVKHPQFTQAYEALLDIVTPPEGFFELDEDSQIELICEEMVTVYVDPKGNLRIEHHYPTNDHVWINGKWVEDETGGGHPR